MKQYDVRPSVPAWVRSRKPAAAGLLLWARLAEISIDCHTSGGPLRAVPRRQRT